MKRDKTFGIYVPSYKRYDCIKTDKVLNDCTYVVRESEEQLYWDAGVRKILAAPDQEIDSLPKIRQWIIDHTPEDIIVQIDDDIERFSYVNKVNMEEIPDPDIIDAELVRIGQILSDLNLGFASIRMQESVIKYNEEFRFSSTIGLVCWFNKASLKSRYDENVRFKADTDFQLSELLNNRIIIVPEYLRAKAQYDKNSGGNNTNKNSSTMNETIEYLKNKWGKYYEHNFKTNQSKVKVRR